VLIFRFEMYSGDSILKFRFEIYSDDSVLVFQFEMHFVLIIGNLVPDPKMNAKRMSNLSLVGGVFLH
jgi:hypothetical protein